MKRYGSRRNDNEYGDRAPVHGAKSSRARAKRKWCAALCSGSPCICGGRTGRPLLDEAVDVCCMRSIACGLEDGHAPPCNSGSIPDQEKE